MTDLFHQVKSELPLGDIRRHELALSAWALGVRQVECLGLKDIPQDEWGRGKGWDREPLISTLREAILGSGAQLILTHGPRGGYGHPAHQEVSHCVATAARDVSFTGSLFSFAGYVKHGFFSWHFDQPSNVLIDARTFLRRRVASLSYHQTQSEYFLRPDTPQAIHEAWSAMFGLTFGFTEAGRKCIPIVTARRFFRKFPTEGLVLQMAPNNGRPHFFQEHFGNDARVRVLPQ